MVTTSCFSSFQGPGRISIARFAPRNIAPGYRVYKKLAPGPWFNKVPDAEYRKLFAAEILAPLDPQETWDKLHEMADGADPVLLCWERPHDLEIGKTKCHRRQVAEWFFNTLGHQVDELGRATPAQLRAQQDDPNARLICDRCGTTLINTGTGPHCPLCLPLP